MQVPDAEPARDGDLVGVLHLEHAHPVDVLGLQAGVIERQLNRFDGRVGDRPPDVLGEGQVADADDRHLVLNAPKEVTLDGIVHRQVCYTRTPASANAAAQLTRAAPPAILGSLRQGDVMAETPSTMVPLGTAAPDFRLPDTDGTLVSRDDFKETPSLLVMFICNHCPFVKHIRDGLAQFGRDYQATRPGDRGDQLQRRRCVSRRQPGEDGQGEAGSRIRFPLSVRRDAAGREGLPRRLHARLLPVRHGRRLVYRGQFDDSRPGNGRPVTGADLRAALDAVLAGKPVPAQQKPSIGCNIKWKAA